MEKHNVQHQQLSQLVVEIPVVKNVGIPEKRGEVFRRIQFSTKDCELCAYETTKKHLTAACPDFDDEDFDLEKSCNKLPALLNKIYNGIKNLPVMNCQEIADLANGVESLLHRVSDSNKAKGFIRTALIKKFDDAKIWERDCANRQAAAIEKRLLNEHTPVAKSSNNNKKEEAQDEENQILRYKDENEYKDRQAEDSTLKLTSNESEKAATAKKLRNDYDVWVQKVAEFPTLELYAR